MDSATPAFNRALELDPLNARIVDSSLVHFRLIGNQEKTTELYERLTQIAPEKKDDAQLGRIHPMARINNLSALFGQTADESIIDAYALAVQQMEDVGPDLLNIDRVAFDYQVGYLKSQLSQMRGIPDSFDEQPPSAPPDDTNADQLFFYLWAETIYIREKLLVGAADDVISAADRMSAAYKELLDSDSSFADIGYLPMCIAWAATDNEAEIDNALEQLTDMEDGVLFSRMGGPFYAYSAVDPEGAAKRLLQRKSEHPNWFGTDWVATQHVTNRELLLHPDMQAFYVEEDKWVDYLAARVPEYAKYRP
jgi:hypothetical protein